MPVNDFYLALRAFFSGDITALREVLKEDSPSETLLRAVISEGRQLVGEDPLPDSEPFEFIQELSRLADRMVAVVPDGRSITPRFKDESRCDGGMSIRLRSQLGMQDRDEQIPFRSASQLLYEAVLAQQWLAMATWIDREQINCNSRMLPKAIKHYAEANASGGDYLDIEFGPKRRVLMLSPELQSSLSQQVRSEVVYPQQEGEMLIDADGNSNGTWKDLLDALTVAAKDRGAEGMLVNDRMCKHNHLGSGGPRLASYLTTELVSILAERGIARPAAHRHHVHVRLGGKSGEVLASLAKSIVNELLEKTKPCPPIGEPMIRRTLFGIGDHYGSKVRRDVLEK